MEERIYQVGSANGTPSKSGTPRPPTYTCALHDVIRAAMEVTLARGPSVAARSGMPVDANHQSLHLTY